MKQSFQNNNSIDLMSITQPEYDTQTIDTAITNDRFWNAGVTTNAQTNTQNNLKRKNNSTLKSKNNTEINILNSPYILTNSITNTTNNLTNAQKN